MDYFNRVSVEVDYCRAIITFRRVSDCRSVVNAAPGLESRGKERVNRLMRRGRECYVCWARRIPISFSLVVPITTTRCDQRTLGSPGKGRSLLLLPQILSGCLAAQCNDIQAVEGLLDKRNKTKADERL